jgi:hypothetical protein
VAFLNVLELELRTTLSAQPLAEFCILVDVSSEASIILQGYDWEHKVSFYDEKISREG